MHEVKCLFKKVKLKIKTPIKIAHGEKKQSKRQ